MTEKQICIIPKLEGLGGPASFQQRLIPILEENGYHIHHDVREPQTKIILVNGGTRDIIGLLNAKRRGAVIVQRLAQTNWVHRWHWSGWGFYYRSVRNNLLLAAIRRFLADRIIYQSDFVQSCWEKQFGKLRKPQTVIYNGLDVNLFCPKTPLPADTRPIRIAVVEGHLGEGNEVYLANAIHFGEALAEHLQRHIILCVAGDVPFDLREKWHRNTPIFTTEWLGVVSRESILGLNRSAHFLFSAELNGGCPNAVIEALACGTPVVGFATGALPELLSRGGGIAVPYGANYWRLEPPDISGLVNGAVNILQNLAAYQQAARANAVAHFAIEQIAQRYLQMLETDTD